MTRFDECIQHTLDVEGGFVNDPDDSGGATKWGITLGFYRSYVDSEATVEDIRTLGRKQAKKIYRRKFWRPAEFAVDGCTYSDLPVGPDRQALSMAINAGWKKSHTIIQKAIVDAGGETSTDGWLGPSTVTEASKIDAETLIERIAINLATFYAEIVLADRSQQKFLEGWMFRAISDCIHSVTDLQDHNEKKHDHPT